MRSTLPIILIFLLSGCSQSPCQQWWLKNCHAGYSRSGGGGAAGKSKAISSRKKKDRADYWKWLAKLKEERIQGRKKLRKQREAARAAHEKYRWRR